MKVSSLIILYSFGAICFTGCLQDYDLKNELNMLPTQLEDGWEVSSPEKEGLDPAALRDVYETFFAEDQYITALSLLVVRNGKLVAEGYCRDLTDQDVKRNMQSMTKAVTSLTFGIAWDQGYFGDLGQTLYEILPEKFDNNPDKRNITLRHLLTMYSGLDFDNDMFAEELHREKKEDQLKYILSKPLFAAPGETWNYRDCDPQLLGGAIHKKTGKILAEFAKEWLFDPMGIDDYLWETNIDGNNWAAQALYMRPRDIAKIGKLVLAKGAWDSVQLVSSNWIEQMTSVQVEESVLAESDYFGIAFGFLWWIIPQEKSFVTIGSGGQYIYIVPEKDLLIVMTSEPYGDENVATPFGGEAGFLSIARDVENAILH